MLDEEKGYQRQRNHVVVVLLIFCQKTKSKQTTYSLQKYPGYCNSEYQILYSTVLTFATLEACMGTDILYHLVPPTGCSAEIFLKTVPIQPIRSWSIFGARY